MPEAPEVNGWAEQVCRKNERLGNPDYTSKSAGKPWEYLLKDASSGPLYAYPRGKQLALACGNHATVISFALEAHLMGMKRIDYDEIISASVPGSDADRGHLHHGFVVPERFREPNSSPTQSRTVNIFLAWVSEEWVWALVDFARLVRFYVISRDARWSREDITPSSHIWSSLWSAFASGPDWNFETRDAIQCTRDWRRRTLAKKRVSFKPIINILGDSNEPAFFAFGRHTANDFLHSIGLFPGCPAIWICSQNTRFEKFLQGIIDYMRTWVQPKFLTMAAGWRCGIESTTIDSQFAGYATTIGLAEFHELKANRLNYDLLLKNPNLLKGILGRKAKLQSTGAPGRPYKALTIGQKRKLVDSYAKAKRAAGVSNKPTKKKKERTDKKLLDYFK
ncbi:hypothetical protein HWV62_26931 [Athelia sp. TMB]|nr:hypothetical protein HWV62_26931 [Athelia sp. TMB]